MAPRKTLEDIRREVDAEFAPPDDDLAGDEAFPAPRRTVGRRGYLVAGLIGCIVGQALILAYVGVALYAGDAGRLRIATSPPMPSAPVLAASDAAAPTAAPEDTPAASTASTERAPAAPSAAGDADATVTTSPTLPAVVADEPKRVDPPPARVARQTPSSMAPAPRPPRPGLGDWVESQAQLRSALTEWLALSGYGGGDTTGADAEVILGADGRTAKTRVPTTLRGRVVMREQRWERASSGWIIVDDRQLFR